MSFQIIGSSVSNQKVASLLLFEMSLASPLALIQFGLGGLIFSFILVACVQIVVGWPLGLPTHYFTRSRLFAHFTTFLTGRIITVANNHEHFQGGL